MTFPSPAFFAETGLSMKPDTIFSVGGFAVTSSMIVSFITAGLIILVVQIGMRAPKLVPTGMQNFIEWVVEILANFLEGILGRATMQRSFWFFASIFIFILSANFISLLPGVGTVGYGHGSGWQFQVDQPFLRGANADVNQTAAMSAIFFFLWFYWCIRAGGFGSFFHHIFGSKANFQNPFAKIFFALIFFAVGWVEVISITVIRPLAFTFRLFGNIFGGEYLLHTIYTMAPNFAFLLLIPFYFLEVLVAFIQAFVFFVLTAAFTGVMTKGSEHGAAEGAAH